MAYALIHPTLRIILRHNKAVVWQKSKVSDQRTALSSVFGTSLLARMGVIEFHDENGSGIHVLGYVPRPGYDLEITGRAVNDRCFVFVNGRPVQMKQVSQLIKQYYSRQTTVSSNRCPVAFLSVNVPPELLDVNLEPNKTSVMLTNKDELMTILTDLLEEFYSDEKNKLPSSKVNDCNSSTEKRIAVISKLEDITNTCDLNGEVITQRALSNAGEKSKEKERYYLHLGTDMVLDDCPSLVQPEVEGTRNKQAKAISSSSLLDSSSAQDKTSSYNNDMQSEKTSCHEGGSPADEVNDKMPSSVLVHKGTVNQTVSLPSSLQDDTSELSPTDSLQSVELGENLSDKTLCEASESTCNLNNKCNSFKVSRGATENDCLELFETISDRTLCEARESTCDLDNGCYPSGQSRSVKETGLLDTVNNLSNLNSGNSNKQNEMQEVEVPNTGNRSNVTNTERRPERSQEMPSKNKTLGCTPSNSPSLQNLFSLDLDDVFEDSDLDLFGTGINSNLKTPGTSDNVSNTEKGVTEVSPSANVEGSVSAPKSSETSKFLCSDKDWSIGRGIFDKQGNPVQPVTLVTPGPLRQISVNRTTVVTPLHGKRKHSSDKEKSRLSLSSKKIKKSPEITNQPLINQVMSPNPLQRKLLYKKKEIPFSLSDLKESVKRKTDLRSEENSEQLIGRLDPWGVWLLRRGTDLVCVNQYRIQEKLLFQRLMACHSLPKEGLNHPITLNERIVGGPDCWRTLCNMSSKCDPPDTTRWIDDERLTSNGFDVCFKTDADSGDTKAELYKMSTSIPFYGVPDLAEVLQLACHKDKSDSDSLSSCRPFKVVHYLQGEAVRVARALSSRMNRAEVDELLSRMEEQIPEDTRTCVHGRPFFEKIAEIPQE